MSNAKKPKTTPPDPIKLKEEKTKLITTVGDQAYGAMVNFFNALNNSKRISEINLMLQQIEAKNETKKELTT